MISKPSSTRAFWDTSLTQLLEELAASKDGLSSEEVQTRLRTIGPNTLERVSRWEPVREFFHFLVNPLVIILLVASLISLLLGEQVNAAIIMVIVLLSVLLNFLQVSQAHHAVAALQRQVAITASVTRDGQTHEIPVADVVPGDLLQLNAGDLVSADARLLTVNDLHMREAALTGESLPVEKTAGDLTDGPHAIADATNSVFAGTAVQSGLATAIVVQTGTATSFGEIASRLAQRPPETEFDRGIRQFGLLVTRIILILVVFVFLINVLLRRPIFESFLFAVALAVGLTPELLPMIITITLASGARRMARKHVIVKRLEAIENFGSMEILCCDKTGTLTEGEIQLEKHVRIDGTEDERVLQWIYLNSHFEAGIKSPIDDAILKHSHPDIASFQKVDEIPFDFTRKRLSVAVERDGQVMLVTKGEAEGMLAICTAVEMDAHEVPMDTAIRTQAERTYRQLSEEGYRVLAVAIRRVDKHAEYHRSDEHDMTLVGFAAFLDPPKSDVARTLTALKQDGLQVVIMTGDNAYVTRAIAEKVELPTDRVITGTELDGMADDALAYLAEKGAIFARVNPEQKNRVILALKHRGHVVGFLGDGINDAPSLHAADIGISVQSGVDVAKDAANIILLEKSLQVLHDGVREGRRSFANIMKYIVMGTSSNFGNMFSMAGGSLFLPFLPMLPTQILLNNLLYDLSQLGIPTDKVDTELSQRPKRWRIAFIREFMLIIGPISSLYDFLTFGVLLLIFRASAPLFHTGWFVESLATQTLVVFIIRTAANPFRSRPSSVLVGTVLTIVLIAVLLPYAPFVRDLGFTPLPLSLLGIIAALTLTYLLLVQWVKSWFYRRHALI